MREGVTRQLGSFFFPLRLMLAPFCTLFFTACLPLISNFDGSSCLDAKWLGHLKEPWLELPLYWLDTLQKQIANWHLPRLELSSLRKQCEWKQLELFLISILGVCLKKDLRFVEWWMPGLPMVTKVIGYPKRRLNSEPLSWKNRNTRDAENVCMLIQRNVYSVQFLQTLFAKENNKRQKLESK